MDDVYIIRPLDAAAEVYSKNPDDQSANAVLESAEGLIKYFIQLYGKAYKDDDLFQIGCFGLMKALKSYDANKGASFVTYASHCIMGEIRHAVRKQAAYYKPGCIIELQFKVDKVVEEYTSLHGAVPTMQYIADRLKVKRESVDEVMRAGLICFDDIDTAKIHSSEYETFCLPIEDKLLLNQAVRNLSDIQKKVIQLLFYRDMSQQQVADKIGISQRNVSRIKESSIRSMQNYFREIQGIEDKENA